MEITTDPRVSEVFQKYPDHILPKITALRNLILEAAESVTDLEEIQETLKWGEPSYLSKKGSTIRIDWKRKAPDQYAMYFKCTSRLVPTFKTVYGDLFNYENNRAILFSLDQSIPQKELKNCIKAALTYHKVKSEPLLLMTEN